MHYLKYIQNGYLDYGSSGRLSDTKVQKDYIATGVSQVCGHQAAPS